MLRRAVLVVLMGIAAACQSSTQIGEFEGDGCLTRIRVPGQDGWNRAVRDTARTFDEQFVLYTTTGHGAIAFVTDADGEVLAKGRDAKCFAASRSSSEALFLRYTGFHRISIPTLQELEFVSDDECDSRVRSALMNGADLQPTRRGWVCVTGSGVVLEIDSDPLRIGRSVDLDLDWAYGEVSDVDADVLYLLDKSGFLLAFDLARMEPTARIDLPCDGVNLSLAARGDRAWVGTLEGEILHVDTWTMTRCGRTVVDRAGGRVDLDLSQSSQRLVAAAQSRREAEGRRLTIAVYRVEGSELLLERSCRFLVPKQLHDLTILERHERVIISTYDQELIWYYGEQRPPTTARYGVYGNP